METHEDFMRLTHERYGTYADKKLMEVIVHLEERIAQLEFKLDLWEATKK